MGKGGSVAERWEECRSSVRVCQKDVNLIEPREDTMNIKTRISLIVLLAVLVGCGGGAAVKPAAEKAEKPAAEGEKPAAAEGKEKPAEAKPAAEKPAAEKPAAEKPAEAAPVIEEKLVQEVKLVNGFVLTGLIVKEDKNEVVLRTEVGNVTLLRVRIVSITPVVMPPRLK